MTSLRTAHLLAISATVLWSLNFTGLKEAFLHGFEPLAFGATRWAIVAVVLVALTLASERSLYVARRDLPLMVGGAGVGFAINQAAAVYALDVATATTAAMLFGLAPILTALLAHVLVVERIPRRHWLGAGASFIGVALVAIGAGAGSGGTAAIVLGLANAATFAAFAVVISRLGDSYSSLRVNALASASCAIGLALPGLPQLVGQDWAAIDAVGWSALAYTAAAAACANVVWLKAAQHVGPGRASLYTNLQPLVGAVLAFAILGEAVTALQVAGGCVICGAIIWTTTRGAPAPPGHRAPARPAPRRAA